MTLINYLEAAAKKRLHHCDECVCILEDLSDKHCNCGTLESQNILKLCAMVREATKALEFYAKETNYSIDDYRGVSGEMIKRCILYGDCEERNEVYSYAGLRARETLKKLQGET